MSDYKTLTIDYLEGRIAPPDYEAMIETDDQLYQWFQQIVPKDKKFSYCTPPSYELIYYPYDIRTVMKVHERLEYGGPKGTPAYHYYIHSQIFSVVKEAFPDLNIQVDDRPRTLRFLCLRACPRYIGGHEVADNNIIGKILSDIPAELSPAKQEKMAKERIKKAFYIEGNHYPRWIQEPEWPVHNGKPMQYVNTTRLNSEFVQHHFVDVDTGASRTVNDFY